jgi:hypothetical protein
MINARTKTLIITLAAIICTNSIVTVSALSETEIADLFKIYDTSPDVEEEPECQEPEVDAIICPKDEKLPCGELDGIKEHCASIIGKDVAAEMENVGTGKGLNAMRGCMKYVGYYLAEEDHMACCESDHCEDWLDDYLANLEGYYYDDDDEGVEKEL